VPKVVRHITSNILWFSDGFSARSITMISTAAFSQRNRNPNCSKNGDCQINVAQFR